MALTLVDTSSWVHALRPAGDPAVTGRVRALLESGEAAWCPMVRLELWNGARGARERRVLTELSAGIRDLPIDPPVWQMAMELAQRARSRGQTLPATDLLILACARRHGAPLEHADAHLAGACSF
jgi:predicted nucleic acid-binding protein